MIKRVTILSWSIMMLLLIQTISSSQPFPHAAHAASIWYVNTAGSDSNPCTIAAPCKSPQRAVNVASSGDTVRFAVTTYQYNSVTHGTSGAMVDITKTLTLEGGWNSSFTNRDSASYSSTIFDGNNTGVPFNITGNNVVLDGLAIDHSPERAIWAKGTNPTFNNLTIQNCGVAGNATKSCAAFYNAGQATIANTLIAGIGGIYWSDSGDNQLNLINTTVKCGLSFCLFASGSTNFTLVGGLFIDSRSSGGTGLFI